MTTIEYDLDLTGGLMEEIHKLVAPPVIDDKSRRLRVKERINYRKPGKLPNRDSCDSCKEGGDLLCCDRCPSAFHLQCHDPPLEDDDVPPGEWLCHYCIHKPANGPTITIEDDDAGSTCSTNSRHSQLSCQVPGASNSLATLGAATGSKRFINYAAAGIRRIRGTDSDYLDLDFTDITDDDRSNPLRLLARATKVLNPRQFELPKDIVCPINFPGSSKLGASKRKPGRNSSKRNLVELDKGVVPLPAQLCFVCDRSCRVASLLRCDYCPLVFHLDCLSPPLTALPYGRWMCPNHVEHVLDDKLLKSVRLTERIQLWDRYSGAIDSHSVKLQFLDKVHRKNSMFRVKQSYPDQQTTKVPQAVKAMYKSARARDNVTFTIKEELELYQETKRNSELDNCDQNTLLTPKQNEGRSVENESSTSLSGKRPGGTDEDGNSLSNISKKPKLETITTLNHDDCDDGDKAMDMDTVCESKHTVKSSEDNLIEEKNKNLNLDRENRQLDSNTQLKYTACDDYRQARALLCPLAHKLPSAPMMYKTFTIGTGAEMDVCLEDFGHCSKTSVKHACIFFDELSGEYELLNYSEHGTVVENVLYSCDISARPAISNQRKPNKLVSDVRQVINTSSQSLVPLHAINENHTDSKSGKVCKVECECTGEVRGGAEYENEKGWEGPAVLHHGSHISIGCLDFVFSIIDKAAMLTDVL